MMFKITLIFLIIFNEIILKKFNIISPLNKSRSNYFDTIDTNASLDFIENYNNKDNNNNDENKSENLISIDSIFNSNLIINNNVYYEIKEKKHYIKLQHNYYKKQNYNISNTINFLYILPCIKAFKYWLKIFDKEILNKEYKIKQSIFCNNFKLIVKHRFEYFKSYMHGNTKNLNLLRLTPFSWLTNEEFENKYLSNNYSIPPTKNKKPNKKKRLQIENTNYNKNSQFTEYTTIIENSKSYVNSPLKFVYLLENDNKTIKLIESDKTKQPLLDPNLFNNHYRNINVKDTKDWSQYLGKVENQNKNDDCWAYSTMALVESYYKILSNTSTYKRKKTNISYSRIVDCFDDKKIITSLSYYKLKKSIVKYGFSFDNNYPNNHLIFNGLRKKCLANNINPDIKILSLNDYTTNIYSINNNNNNNNYNIEYNYAIETIKPAAALEALQYGPYISMLYSWPGIMNCEICKYPPRCYNTNHVVIVYKILNKEVYFRNSWGLNWGVNGNGSITANYVKENTFYPRKACGLLDYVLFPSKIKISNNIKNKTKKIVIN